MRIKHTFRRMAALLCAAVLLVNLIPAAWGADAALRVGSTSAAPGETRSVYVGGSDLADLAAIQGIVTYNADALELTGAAMVNGFSGFGAVDTETTGQVSFSGTNLDGISGSQNILRLDFRVKSDAAPDDYPLEILISDACDTQLSSLTLLTGPGVFTVTKPQSATKTLYFSGSASNTSLYQGDTVAVTARVNSSQGLSAGKLTFRYDASLFDLISIEPLANMSSAVTTLDTSHPGYISAAFASAEALPSGELLRLTLRVTADTDTDTAVTFSASDLYDEAQAAMDSVGFTRTLMLYKADTAEELPALRVTMPAAAATNETITAAVLLDGRSALAAGDFCITYDPEVLTCLSVETNPDISNDNGVFITTNPNTGSGEVRFTYICTSGLSSDVQLLTITFQPRKEAYVTLVPSAVSTPADKNRNPISLSMVSGACDVKDPFFTVQFLDEDGTLLSSETVRYRTAAAPPAASKAPDASCHYQFTGWSGDYSCITADAVFTAAYQAVPHTVVVDAAVAPTYTESGLTEGAHCSICGTVLIAQEIIPKLEELLGDVNGDGKVNILDVDLVYQYLLDLTQLDARQMKAANVTGSDDIIDVYDIQRLYEAVAGISPLSPPSAQ